MSLDRRIRTLEERTRPREVSPKLVSDLNVKWLDSLAAAKQRIYGDGFSVDWLRSQAPITVAAHVVWLSVVGDEREDEVREILDEMVEDREIEAGPLHKLIQSAEGELRV